MDVICLSSDESNDDDVEIVSDSGFTKAEPLPLSECRVDVEAVNVNIPPRVRTEHKPLVAMETSARRSKRVFRGNMKFFLFSQVAKLFFFYPNIRRHVKLWSPGFKIVSGHI